MLYRPIEWYAKTAESMIDLLNGIQKWRNDILNGVTESIDHPRHDVDTDILNGAQKWWNDDRHTEWCVKTVEPIR